MITMVMTALLLFGLLSYRNLPLNLLPDTKIPFITIQTVYPGAAPEQIESQITKKIEDEISAVSRIKSISSYSVNSASIVLLEFELDKDPDVANQEVKDRLDAIANELPDGAETPVVSKVDVTALPVMDLVLSGSIDPTELYYLADTGIKDSLSRIRGVGSVEILGGQEREVRIAFDNKTVYENSISLTQVAGILAYANMDMPGGNFQNEEQDYAVSLRGQISRPEDLEEIMIPTSSGMRKLDQLASIEPVSEDVRQRITYFNNTENFRENSSVLISVIKSSEGNPVDIADEVRAALPSIRAELPESVDLRITSDDSLFIKDTVKDTLGNIIMGIAFTAAILLFFLHDLRSTLIVALTMPLSIIPTFIVLKYLGITINMMSLMGLSTSVGVLVMNSVVVLQNIFRHKEMGHSRKKAASTGTAEVTVAVLASTLTNVCVFLPIGTMNGIVGLFLKDFALTVVVATLFSLLISFTLTPMLASLLLPETKKKKMKISQGIEDFFKSLERGYTYLLEKILRSRSRSLLLILFTLVLFGGTMYFFTKIPFEFTPMMDNGVLRVEVELPQDASLDQTAGVLTEIENVISRYEEVDTVITHMGQLSTMDQGTNLAGLDIQLIDKELREDSKTVATRMGSDLAAVPNARIRVLAISGAAGGMGSSAPVEFYLQGDSMDDLILYSDQLKLKMEEIPGLTAVNTSMKLGKPEVVLLPDRRKLAELGVTVQDLAMGMRSAIEGVVLTQMKADGREYDIRVTLTDEDVSGYENIRNIAIPTPAGIYPLSFFADIEIEDGINQLMRVDKRLSVKFTADTMPGTALSDVTRAIEKTVDDMNTDRISLNWGGNAEMMADTVSSMAFAFIIAIVLTYMLLAAILERFGQPLLILSTVPLSLIGVVLLFMLTGYAMNMVSMLAIIMLVGMVVNNAILILEFSNQLRAEGMDVRSALLKSCPIKLQPILMSNTATILGMLPMALGIGSAGAEMRQPMGLVSIGGLLAATFLSLFVIPALENTIESRKDKTKKENSLNVKETVTV